MTREEETLITMMRGLSHMMRDMGERMKAHEPRGTDEPSPMSTLAKCGIELQNAANMVSEWAEEFEIEIQNNRAN